MDVNKAIKKQKKRHNHFILSMCFIFCVLPVILFISKKVNIFFISYLLLIEFLIIISIFIRSNNDFLEFHKEFYKLKIRSGILKRKYTIICDKVALVHTESSGKNIQIILLTISQFRNENIRCMSINFLKNHPYVSEQYKRIKKIHPENKYYYIIIKNGGYIKYELLDEIYRSCVYAFFTEDAIKQIKEYRG